MSQLQKKFIADNAIDGTKIHLSNNESIRARNASNTNDIDIIKLSAIDNVEFGVAPSVNPALPQPSTPNQLTTVEYVTDSINAKLAVVYSKRIDAVSDVLVYRGEALPGTLDNDPHWRIAKIELVGSTYVTKWANGNSDLSNVWSDHLTLSYS